MKKVILLIIIASIRVTLMNAQIQVFKISNDADLTVTDTLLNLKKYSILKIVMIDPGDTVEITNGRWFFKISRLKNMRVVALRPADSNPLSFKMTAKYKSEYGNLSRGLELKKTGKVSKKYIRLTLIFPNHPFLKERLSIILKMTNKIIVRKKITHPKDQKRSKK